MHYCPGQIQGDLQRRLLTKTGDRIEILQDDAFGYGTVWDPDQCDDTCSYGTITPQRSDVLCSCDPANDGLYGARRYSDVVPDIAET